MKRAILVFALFLTALGAGAVEDNAVIDASIDKRYALIVNQQRFVVDNQTKSILCLISTDNPSSIELNSPSGQKWIIGQTSENISWQKIQNLYAINIESPEQGQWQIQGKMIKEPEVLVKSDLQMQTPTIPNNMLRGENLNFQAAITEQGKVVSKGPLLENTNFIATIQNIATDEVYRIVLNPPNTQSHGLYEFQMKLDNLPGVYEVNIEALGLLFQRQRKQQFFLHDYPVSFTSKVDGEHDTLTVEAKLASSLLERSSCQISALFTDFKGVESIQVLNLNDNQDWFLIKSISSDINKMSLILTGYLKDSRYVSVSFPEIRVSEMLFDAHQKIKQEHEKNYDYFWKAIFNEALMRTLPYTPDKLVDNLLAEPNLQASLVVPWMRKYPTSFQYMINNWFLQKNYSQPVNEAKSTEITNKNKKSVAEKRIVTKKIDNPLLKKRIWFIGFFVIFSLFFLGLIAWLMVIWFKSKRMGLQAKDEPLTEMNKGAQAIATAQEKIQKTQDTVQQTSQLPKTDKEIIENYQAAQQKGDVSTLENNDQKDDALVQDTAGNSTTRVEEPNVNDARP